MKKLRVIMSLTLVAMLVFTVTLIQAKDNPANSPPCYGLRGEASAICTTAVATGCYRKEIKSQKACEILETQYKDKIGNKPPWIPMKRLTKIEIDANNDGTMDYAEHYTPDANGSMTKEEWDHNNDGTVDRIYYYTSE